MSAGDQKNNRASPVAQFLKRNQLDDLIPVFAKESCEKLFELRKLADSDKFAALVPDQGKRDKIKEALTKSAQQQSAANAAGGNDAGSGAANAGHGNDHHGGPGGFRAPRPCRDFATKGTCQFGADCKFSHDGAAGVGGGDAPADGGSTGHRGGASGSGAPRLQQDSYEAPVTINNDMVKFLLKDGAKALITINKRHHTHNQRIENVSAFEESVTFMVRGAKENVEARIKDIYHAIGIESQQRREARYQYAAKELEFNKKAIDYLVAGNVKNRGSCLELSSKSLQLVAQTFRFPEPPKVHHFVVYAGITDREKNEKLIPLLKNFVGIQAMLFAPHNRVADMEKHAGAARAAFRNLTPIFVHRDQGKDDRMKNFEAFKSATGNPVIDEQGGVVQRLLVTQNDFAKLARKEEIPYVNLVVHFNASDKETYQLQMACTGRRNKPGISLLFADVSFSKELVAGLKQDFDVTILDGTAQTQAVWTKAVASLGYDTQAAPLTKDSDYPASDWRVKLDQEKAEQAAAGIVKQAPPKPKPKAKKVAKKEGAAAAGADTKQWGRQ